MISHGLLTVISMGWVACFASCSSPTLALRDLKAIHELDETRANANENESSATPAATVGYRKAAPLYGNIDRLLFETGLPELLPELSSWVEPSASIVEEPEILSVELLVELEQADTADTVLVCRTLSVIGGFLLYDPSPLARRRCAAILGRFAAAMPRESGTIELDGAEADLRFAALIRQIRRDLGDRMLAASEGREIDAATLELQRRPLIELREMRTANRDVAMRLLDVLAELFELETPEVLRVELERSCRVLSGDLARRQLAHALELRDQNEWVRSEVATAWMNSEGAAGLTRLLSTCGLDDSEPVRRTLIALMARHPRSALEASGALSWLARLADEESQISSLDAARFLRELTGLDLHAGEGWTEELRVPSGS